MAKQYEELFHKAMQMRVNADVLRTLALVHQTLDTTNAEDLGASIQRLIDVGEIDTAWALIFIAKENDAPADISEALTERFLLRHKESMQ